MEIRRELTKSAKTSLRKGHFSQGTEQRRGGRKPVGAPGKGTPRRGNSKCEGPEVGLPVVLKKGPGRCDSVSWSTVLSTVRSPV